MCTSSASRHACVAPAPPNGTSVNSRVSMPFLRHQSRELGDQVRCGDLDDAARGLAYFKFQLLRKRRDRVARAPQRRA
jgi:hypothetical protein